MKRSFRRKTFLQHALLLALLLPGTHLHAQSGDEAPKLAQSTYDTLTDALASPRPPCVPSSASQPTAYTQVDD